MIARERKRGRTRTMPAYTLTQERLLTSMLRRETTKLVGSGEKSWSWTLIMQGLVTIEGDTAKLTDAGRVIAVRLESGESITRTVEVGA